MRPRAPARPRRPSLAVVVALAFAVPAAHAGIGRADDSPLVPPRLVSPVRAAYPDEARRAGLTGTVRLELSVSADGRVAGIRVLQRAGHGFDESAVAAARQLRFEPATRAGKPIAVRIGYEIAFASGPRADASHDTQAASGALPEYGTTVRAFSVATPLEDAAADASVITSDRTPRAGESVADLLAEEPGVTVNRTGGIGSLAMISLRGSTWDQVNVYVDGVPLNSGVAGGVDLSTLPLGDVDRIEIYRGSSPIAFGSSAMGGTVSITTRTPQTTGVSVEGGVGSFDTESGGVTGSWVSDRVRLYLGTHYLTSVGNFFFTDDNGTPFDTAQDHQVERANNWVQQVDGVARAVVSLGGSRELSISQMTFTRNQGLPGYGSIEQTTDTRLETLRFIESVAYESKDDLGPGGRLRAIVYTIDGDQKYDDPHGEISIAPEDTNDQTWALGTTLRLSRLAVSWLTVSGVLDGRYEEFFPYDADDRPAYGATATRLFGGAGVEADALVPPIRLHIIPSVRVEAIDDARSGITFGEQEIQSTTPIAQAAPTGRLALLEPLTNALSLHASGGRYVRFPSMYELYGNSGFVVGNPTLQPEAGWNGDVGAGWRAARRSWSATLTGTLFASYAENLIQFQQDAYGRAQALNLGRTRILGAEASADVRLTPYFRLNASGTCIDARDVSDDALGAREPLLPNLPPFHVYARPEGRLPPIRGVVLGAYADADLTDGNYLDAANLVPLPARVLIGAGIFAEDAHHGLSVTASGQNLADVRTFDFAGFPLPSRSFFLTARWALAQEN